MSIAAASNSSDKIHMKKSISRETLSTLIYDEDVLARYCCRTQQK